MSGDLWKKIKELNFMIWKTVGDDIKEFFIEKIREKFIEIDF
jgi:hypothetical protein